MMTKVASVAYRRLACVALDAIAERWELVEKNG